MTQNAACLALRSKGEIDADYNRNAGAMSGTGKLMGAILEHWLGRAGRVQVVRAYIENNLEWGDLSPANAARALGVSVRQLHLLFEPTGTTFSRYVMARRLDRACGALADPNRSVLEIAMSCGIESSTVFYRAFRQAYGITPTEYRRALHGAAEGGGQTAMPSRVPASMHSSL